MGVIARATDASDVDLVAAVRAGDDCAFEELYRRYSRRVAGYVCRMVGDPDRAEDVTQEAFFSALRRLRQTDAAIVFKPWIFEIAKNAAIDQFRRTSRAEEVSLQAEDGLRPGDQLRLVGGSPAPDAAYASKERLDHLTGAFDELSDSHSRILVLRELEGLSYREIGERMAMTRPAVESTLFRARRRLNEEYEELDTGARCISITAAIARLAEGIDSQRDRRRVGRHVHRCSSCRRHARQLGVTVERPVRSRVAALLPLPALARRRRGAGHDGSAVTAGHGYASGVERVAGAWAPAVVTTGAAEGTAQAWSKVVAVVATVALAGGGAAIHERIVDPHLGGQQQVAPSSDRNGGADRPARGDSGAGSPAGGGQSGGTEGRPGGSGRRGEVPALPGDVRAPGLGGHNAQPVGPPGVAPPDVPATDIPATPAPDTPPVDGRPLDNLFDESTNGGGGNPLEQLQMPSPQLPDLPDPGVQVPTAPAERPSPPVPPVGSGQVPQALSDLAG